MGFLSWKKVGFLTPAMQVGSIICLYILTTLIGYREYLIYGTMFGYSLSISILFVPIYEEILFRGFILSAAEKYMKWGPAVALVSFLFALWHFKNIFYLSPERVIMQMLYTGLIVSPVFSSLTLKTRTIWPAVILHYIHNLLAQLF